MSISYAQLRSTLLLAVVLLPATTFGQSLKVVANPEAVYPGYYHIGDVAVGYGQMTAKSGGNAPPIVFSFHDWNKAGLEVQEPVLQDFDDPMENDFVTPLQLAERIDQDGGVLALAWDPIGYFFEHPDYWTGGGHQPITWGAVLGGDYDAYIRRVARQVRDFGKPIMLSVTAEFNSVGFVSFGPDGNTYFANLDTYDELRNQYGDPDVPDGPERVRDLNRHIIDIFREEKVENVTWFMYSHSAYMNPDDLDGEEDDELFFEAVHPRHYYPGDDYIDWIGNSAYVSADDPERDLAYAVEHGIAAFREFTEKPFFIPEFGVESPSAANRADRMRTLFEEEMEHFPDIRAFAMADGELWEQYFDIPILGHDPEELEVWQDSVWGSDYYTGELLLEEIPEPTSAMLMLLGIAGCHLPGLQRQGFAWNVVKPTNRSNRF